jgi:RND family efflux transporter MFP subunit
VGARQRLERSLEGAVHVRGPGAAAAALDREALEGVVQLAHVAGPLVGREARQGGLVELERRQPRSLRQAGEGRPHQGRHVAAARAQRGQLQVHHGEAVVEVGPEAPGAHLAAQVAARGRDDPGRHPQRLDPPDPLELPVLQHAQQRGLQARLELPHLVQEDRALPRALEAPDATGHGPGEGAALVTEQLALDHGGRQRGAICADEGAAPLRQAVERARRHALAGAGLPGQQHRGAQARHLLQGPPQGVQRRAVAHQLPAEPGRARPRAAPRQGRRLERRPSPGCRRLARQLHLRFPRPPGLAGRLRSRGSKESAAADARSSAKRAPAAAECSESAAECGHPRRSATTTRCDKRPSIDDTTKVAVLPHRRHAAIVPLCRLVRAGTALLALGLAACGGPADPHTAATATAARQRIERVVVATGTIEPVKEVEVRPRIAGIVEKIHVAAGDMVQKGQPLVEIERDLLESQVREAQATLREARVEQHYAQIELDRVMELERTGAASPKQGDEARARHESAEASVARAAAALDTLSTELSYATVTSPLAGRVLDVPVEEGSAVSPVTAVTGGTLLLSLAATDTLHLEGLVDENEVARVKVGQPARIRTEAFGDRVFKGFVREIAPLGKRVQNVTYFEVKIQVSDEDAQLLRPRMSGDGDIITEVVDDALVVPETALRYRGDHIYVDVLDGDQGTEPREVKVGIVDGARVQILSGLREGEKVELE